MKTAIVFVTLAIVLTGFGCSTYHGSYAVDFPAESVRLDKKLNEISGLATINDTTLVCLQDEKANVYFIDPRSGAIVDQYDFGKDGDYEGIAFVRNTIYTLRSDGTICQTSRGQKAERFKFKKSKDYDFEGLCYDAVGGRLLVACKEARQKKYDDNILIFAFSLATLSYEEEPVIKLKKDDVHKRFMPSGIAVHPNGNIYVLSSHSKSLLELNSVGEIVGNTALSDYIFHQPEGITFDSKGTLYISNEKANKVPNLLAIQPL